MVEPSSNPSGNTCARLYRGDVRNPARLAPVVEYRVSYVDEPMVVQPLGVGIGVSSASAFPIEASPLPRQIRRLQAEQLHVEVVVSGRTP